MKYASLFVAVLALYGFAIRGEALSIGDKAPELQIAKWLKGDPVPALGTGNNVYVIEFWATWCIPCRESIPHLTELQKQYKDKGLVVIGISTEEEGIVQNFLSEVGSQMDYRVAVDTDRKTWEAYTTPFGAEGLPHAFIVSKKGELLWEGHPMNGMDAILAQTLAGAFDAAQAKQRVSDQKLSKELADQYLGMASTGTNNAGADKVGDQLMSLSYPALNALYTVVMNIRNNTNLKYRNKEFALKVCTKLDAITEGKNYKIAFVYALFLFENGKAEEAVKQAEKAMAVCTDDQMKAIIKKEMEKFKTANTAPKDTAK